MTGGATLNWYTSDRRDRLPDSAQWARIRGQVRERAHNHCQAQQHSVLCNGIGSDCDHIIPGDDHSLSNLQWLNAHCHRLKTARETVERNHARRSMRRHPNEIHPGLM